MLPRQSLNRISNILLVVSSAVLVGSILFLTITLSRHTPALNYQKKAVVNFVQGDDSIRDGKYHYYNGNAFMQMEVASGDTKPLSDLTLLTDISSIYWLKNGAIFNFSTEPPVQELSTMIASKIAELNQRGEELNIASPENLYWYVNFTTGDISYLTYTINPFGISSSGNGDYAYFTDNLTDENYAYFGSVDSRGNIQYGIFGTPSTTPARVVGQKDNDLYIIRSNPESQQISLITYGTATYKEEVILDDIYKDSQNHTVYEEVILSDDSIITNTVDEVTHEKVVTKIFLESDKREVIYTGPESATVQYAAFGAFIITDSGPNTTESRIVDLNGKALRDSIVIQKDDSIPSTIATIQEAIVTKRPYIYIEGKGEDTDPQTERGIENGFDNENSVLERQIYSDTNDINSYVLYISSGSLKEEYAKLVEYIESLDIQRNDITIYLQPSRAVVYNL